MFDRLDGCPDFDERLLESAFAPSPDGSLDAHLAGCERCRRARDRYLRTANALAGALAADGPQVGSLPGTRTIVAPGRSVRPGFLVVAASLLVAALATIVFRSTAGDVVPSAAGVRDARSEIGEPPSIARSPETGKPDAHPLLEPETPARRPAGGLVVVGSVLDEASGMPVEGASIRFVPRRGGGPVVAESVAEGNGRFRVEGVLAQRADSYVVEAEGYALLVQWFREAGRTHPAGTVLELGEIALPRGARVSGRVVTEEGVPVGDAVLLLFDDSSLDSLIAAEPRGESGRSRGDGAFVLAHRVAPMGDRSYRLLVVSKEGLGWTELPVLPGRSEVTGVEVVVRSGATASVRVSDTEGKLVEGAEVYAAPRRVLIAGVGLGSSDLGRGRHPALTSLFTATSDADGRASIPHLPIGEGEATYDFWAKTSDGRVAWQRDVPVRQAIEVNLVLGEVRRVGVEGVVQRRDGSPVAGAVVKGMSSKEKAETDGRGRYRIEGIRSTGGSIWFEVEAPGFGSVSREVRLPPEAEVVEADFVLEPLAPIEGRVVDDVGAPVEGAFVGIQKPTRDETLHEVAGVKTGPDGRFVLSEATEGEWTLWASPPEPRERWAFVDRQIVVRGGDREVEIVLPRARPGRARLVAEVVDMATGAPVDPAQAIVVRPDPRERGSGRRPPKTTLSAGQVVAEGVPVGRWQVWVRAGGGATGFAEFEVGETDTDVRSRVEVGKPGKVAGRVLFDDLSPPPGLLLQISRLGQGRKTHWFLMRGSVAEGGTVLDENGEFRFENLAPGRYDVRVRSEGVCADEEVGVPPGGEVWVDVHAVLGGTLRFRSEGEWPGGSLDVRCTEEGREERMGTLLWVGERGRFDWPVTVRAGRVRWRAVFQPGFSQPGVSPAIDPSIPPAEVASGEADVRAGEEVDVPIAWTRTER